MKRSVLFAGWAAASLAAGTFWACSSTVTIADVPDGGDTNDASIGSGDGSMGGGDSGQLGDSSSTTGDTGVDAGEAICNATTTHAECVGCCASFHPVGADTIPTAARACACAPQTTLTATPHSCEIKCNTTYCQPDGASTLPDSGSSCDICLTRTFAGDAGAGTTTKPYDCLDAALSACGAGTDCELYYACRGNAMCSTKP